MIADSVDYEASILAGERNTSAGILLRDAAAAGRQRRSRDPARRSSRIRMRLTIEILGYDKEAANRATYVSTDVRDAIMLMMPGLIRLFAASENPVFLVPRGA